MTLDSAKQKPQSEKNQRNNFPDDQEPGRTFVPELFSISPSDDAGSKDAGPEYTSADDGPNKVDCRLV
jgi:hypothetical protein